MAVIADLNRLSVIWHLFRLIICMGALLIILCTCCKLSYSNKNSATGPIPRDIDITRAINNIIDAQSCDSLII